jgi:hypothetical protein
MNREMRWCQIAGNASMDTDKTLLRLCGGSDPFSTRGSLFSRIVDDRDTMIPHKAWMPFLVFFYMCDFFLLFLSFIAKITYVDIAGL